MITVSFPVHADYEPVNLDMEDGTFIDLGWELVNGRATVSMAVDTDDAPAANLTAAEAIRLAGALLQAARKAGALAN